MTAAAPDPVLAEQLAYYQARAAEYDQWWLRQGRYDRGIEETKRWCQEAAEVEQALKKFAPRGDVLELAGGTGIWTEKLARTASTLVVVDGSSEMLAINAARVAGPHIERLQADLFEWQPDRQFDVVFFGFWLSHVPAELFEYFWRLVACCLKPGGRYFFVDSRRTPTSTAVDHVLPANDDTVMTRRLDDGREFHIYKLFYDARKLTKRLRGLGWQSNIQETERFFIHGQGQLSSP
jgi:SAM-dependent methyltransferase